MKYVKVSSIVALLLAFLPLLAFGAEQHKSITLLEDVQINGQKLKPGDYQIRFDDSNPNTQVKFVRYGKTVLTAPAQLENQQKEAKAGEFIFENTNGQHNLSRLYVTNNKALVFSNNGQNASSSSESNNPPSQ